jgi:hypothetical protein
MATGKEVWKPVPPVQVAIKCRGATKYSQRRSDPSLSSEIWLFRRPWRLEHHTEPSGVALLSTEVPI